ncbi:hypothetical protein P5V15_003866 [Pogonomyrmex californicus]
MIIHTLRKKNRILSQRVTFRNFTHIYKTFLFIITYMYNIRYMYKTALEKISQKRKKENQIAMSDDYVTILQRRVSVDSVARCSLSLRDIHALCIYSSRMARDRETISIAESRARRIRMICATFDT